MSLSPSQPRLFIVRHARAAAPHPGERDIDRRLEEAGRLDAAAIGARVLKRDWFLGHVICSPARRCRETAAILLETAPHASFTVLDTLYDGLLEAYLAVLADADATAPLTLIGHNPTVEQLAWECLGNATASRVLPGGVQPGTVIAIAADDSDDLLPGRLVDVLAP
jgi:phosphohistidine phosphatase